jgi:DNA-binding NtrC family response regulator
MNEKLLIVDDEPDMLRLLSMIIKERTDYHVTITNNPVEALELFRNDKFDLIISDMKMPGLDGIDFLNAIRQTDPDIPVIIITAYATAEAANKALEKNAFDFITKPFRKEQILFTIEKAMKWITLQRENKTLKSIIDKSKN